MVKNFKSASIVIFVTIYSLIFAELFVRIFDPQPLIPRYIMDSGFGIRGNIPNASYRHVTEEVDVEMRINSVGMRDDRNVSAQKEHDKCRVGIFGDSFFMSYEVSIEDSFAYRLEKMLSEAGHECEVLNFAVSGFGTAESIIQYENFARNYELNYAVLEWHHTDVDDNVRSALYKIEGDQVLRAADEFLPGVATRQKLMSFAVYRWLIQYSHLYASVREKLALFVKALVVDINTVLTSSDELVVSQDLKNQAKPKEEPHYTLHSLLVSKFISRAARDDVKTIVLDVPSKLFDGSLKSSFDYLKGNFSVQPNFCSPLSYLTELNERGTKIFFEKGHKHFTPKGYNALSQSASDCLIEIMNAELQ